MSRARARAKSRARARARSGARARSRVIYICMNLDPNIYSSSHPPLCREKEK